MACTKADGQMEISFIKSDLHGGDGKKRRCARYLNFHIIEHFDFIKSYLEMNELNLIRHKKIH